MQSSNLAIELMIPMQVNKDVVFNEAILKLDSFINMSVISFIEQVPNSIKEGEKYIITTGLDAGKICYKAAAGQVPIILQAPKNMVLLVVKEKRFYYFDGMIWRKILSDAQSHEDNISVLEQINSKVALGAQEGGKQLAQAKDISFVGVRGKVILPAAIQFHYLYMDKDAKLMLDNSDYQEITIIVKQSIDQVHTLVWDENILWDNSPHILTKACNNFDVIKLYKLPETNRFIGKIIAQNLSY